MPTVPKSEYIPGVCNIGPAERRLRRRVGWAGLGLSVVFGAVCILARIPSPWRLFIFLPASLAAVGFLQSAFHFCAGYGKQGVFNFGAEVGKTDTVQQAEFRQKDRQKAQLILILSAMIGLVAAGAAFLIEA
jgi:hypothetical protein